MKLCSFVHVAANSVSMPCLGLCSFLHMAVMLVSMLYLDNDEEQRLDVAGGAQGGRAALPAAQQEGPLTAWSAHSCNVHLTPPHLQALAHCTLKL